MKQIPGLIFLVALVLVLPIAGCRPSCNKDVTHISSDLVAHFSFKNGTYWVYQDSATGNTDSMYVVRNFGGTRCGDADFNEIDIRHTRPLNSLDTGDWVMALTADELGYSRPSTINSATPLFFYPFAVGYRNSNLDTITITSTGMSLSINGVTYPNTATIRRTIFHKEANRYVRRNEYFVVNDEVGILKKTTLDGADSTYTNWQLLRCHIVK